MIARRVREALLVGGAMLLCLRPPAYAVREKRAEGVALDLALYLARCRNDLFATDRRRVLYQNPSQHDQIYQRQLAHLGARPRFRKNGWRGGSLLLLGRMPAAGQD